MRKYFLLLLIITGGSDVFAQKQDSLFVTMGSNGWLMKRKVNPGEDIFALSRRYHVPPAILSDVNNISFQDQLPANSKIIIPLGAYNLLTAKPVNDDARPLYYRLKDESLQKVARTTGVSQRTMQSWNKLETNEVYRGQVLKIGWVLYDNTDIKPMQSPMQQPQQQPPQSQVNLPVASTSSIRVEEDGITRSRTPHTETIIIKMPDTTAVVDTLSEGERLYLSQTSDGTMVANEKGTGVFFKRAGKSTNGIYFAFHNTARRGTILKLYNPGTDKTVYAKVIGKVPSNGTFYNALFGISSDAKAALGTMSNKVWCDVSYAP